MRIVELYELLHREHETVLLLEKHCDQIVHYVRLPSPVEALQKVVVLLLDQGRHQVRYGHRAFYLVLGPP